MSLPSQGPRRSAHHNGVADGADPTTGNNTANNSDSHSTNPADGRTRTANHGATHFTNQQLIDAFATAARKLNYKNHWTLLERAGLDLSDLAADRDARYMGVALETLSNLSADELALLRSELDALVQAHADAAPGDNEDEDNGAQQWIGVVTAASGLNLRAGPSSNHAPVRVLPQGTPVRVLAAEGDWLRVAVGRDRGFVHGEYVARSNGSGGTGGLRLPPTQQLAAPPGATPEMAAIVKVWNEYGAALTAQADRLGIDPGLAVAVLVAESRGDAFGPDGRMIIRFETHIFYQEWGQWSARNRERFDDHFRFNPERMWDSSSQQWRRSANDEWQRVHINQSREWDVFTFARELDEAAAIRSISMGMPQIMGFNYRPAGYSSEPQMFNAFQSGAEQQIAGFFRFIESQGAASALRAGDLHEFARIYNGSGQAARYANIIRERQLLFQQVAIAVLATMQQRGMLVPATAAPQPSAAQPEAQPPARDTVRSVALPTAPASGSALPPPPANLPFPVAPGNSLANVDPELYAAWRQHVIDGFQKNNRMFDRILDGFMRPYNATVTMNRILFGVGIASFVVAAVLSLWTQNTLSGLVFGGLSAVAFIAYFLSRPMQALEQNLQFITWLGIIYNTYWTRLAYSMDLNTVQEDIEDATNDAVGSIKELLDKHAEFSGKRPNVK